MAKAGLGTGINGRVSSPGLWGVNLNPQKIGKQRAGIWKKGYLSGPKAQEGKGRFKR